MSPRTKLLLALSTFAVSATAASLARLGAPFPWIAAAWAIVAVAAALLPRDGRRRLAWANVAAALLAFGLAEAFLSIQRAPDPDEGIRMSGTYVTPGFYFRSDDDLGYAPRAGVQVTARKLVHGRKLYDVVYTIGGNGLRVSPPERAPVSSCVIFFGDSFAFGEGLNDDEALPYRVGELGGGAYRVYNFGFHGYGPHQMLSALERGLADRTIDCAGLPVHVIYEAIPDHVLRASGGYPWDQHGPRYVLGPGGVTLAGHFDDGGPIRKRLRAWLGASEIYARVFGPERGPGKVDVERFLAIVAQSKRTIEARWRGATFTTILWLDLQDPRTGQLKTTLRDGLRARGVDVRTADAILPGYFDHIPRYHMVDDGHPNAYANDLVARYVARAILPGAAATDDRFTQETRCGATR
ncbi:hypothetical protein [Sorangium sp. So ce1182]|uniref:hypothetical protein n=1 Tax=Sorangium sp. So ce1182 TaxID=3133334 RepID=UPI003F62B444